MGKFVIKPTKNGGFKFDLKATNGQVVASSQVYKTIVTCKNGIASVTRFAPIANIEDQTVEGFEKVKHPKFEIFEDKGGKFRFRLKARNGEIILASQGYKTKDTCLNGIESVRKNAPESPVEKEAE